MFNGDKPRIHEKIHPEYTTDGFLIINLIFLREKIRTCSYLSKAEVTLSRAAIASSF